MTTPESTLVMDVLKDCAERARRQGCSMRWRERYEELRATLPIALAARQALEEVDRERGREKTKS